nr:hypothetical protein [Tanacetum cinerariifolium]
MDHYTKRALWIYWHRGDDEVELTIEQSSDSDDEREFTGIFRIETNVFNFEIPLCRTFKEFNCLLQIDPDWLTCSWRNDGYCNGGNFPEAYIIGNSLHYHDYEWYKALEDRELKEEALRNKSIMERTLDDDDESSYE